MRPAVPDAPDAPPEEILYRRPVRLVAGIRELWRSREVVWALSHRDFVARYKQAALGVGWAVFTPVVLMVVFSVFFQRVTKLDTGGAPYALFAYLGLLPWTFFSASLLQGGASLVSNNQLIRKIRCPREFFPISGVAVALVDGAIAVGVLLVLFLVKGFTPHGLAVLAPVFLLIQVAFTLGAVLIASAVLVYVRDLRHGLPVLLQLGLFATPVAYGLSAVPPHWRPAYSLLNPLVPVIDSYRRTILLGAQPEWGLVGLGALGAAIALVGGYALFKKLEPGIADVA